MDLGRSLRPTRELTGVVLGYGADGVAQQQSDNAVVDGTWRVGEDIRPGLYRTTGSEGLLGCTWQRLSGLSGDFDDVIAVGFESGPTYVEISTTDIAFKSSGCEPWARVEE